MNTTINCPRHSLVEPDQSGRCPLCPDTEETTPETWDIDTTETGRDTTGNWTWYPFGKHTFTNNEPAVRIHNCRRPGLWQRLAQRLLLNAAWERQK